MTQINRYKVMIIDDDEVLAGIISSSFEDDDTSIVVCNKPEEAVSLALFHRPQLIIIDVQMKPISGFDLGLSIKSNPQLEDIPIVFISSSKHKEYPLIAFTLGAAAFLTKPLNISHLIQEAKLMMDMCQFKRLARKVAAGYE